jgi:hypothetical protein
VVCAFLRVTLLCLDVTTSNDGLSGDIVSFL